MHRIASCWFSSRRILTFAWLLVAACSSTGKTSAQGSGGNTQGGASGSGGALATGGTLATGGSTATGGRSGSGGAPATGGSSNGGTTASGGTTSSGGVLANGGQPSDASAIGGSGGQGSGGTAADAASDVSKPISYNIMPFGDSITVTMCPPQLLDQELKAKGHTNFTFVGSQTMNQDCNGAPFSKAEGQGGIWATNLVPTGANPDLMTKWATTNQYDVVLMHLGTNDCWSSGAVPNLQSVIDAYSYIVDTFRASNPNVIIFAAQIIPLNPDNCTTCETRVEQLNAMIPAWADSKSTATSPIYVANIHAAFDGLSYTPNSTYTKDGAHPTAAGSQLMADAWYAALQAHGIP